MNREELEKRKKAKLKRAKQVEEAANNLSEDEIIALVPEEELVKHLPVFIRTKDNKRLSGEELDKLAFAIRRQLAGEKILDAA